MIRIPASLPVRPFEFTSEWLENWHKKFEQVYETLARNINNISLIYNRSVYHSGTLTAGQEVFAEVVTDDMYFDVDFGNSQGRAGTVAASITTTLSVKLDGTEIGTVSYSVGVSKPTFSTTGHAQIKQLRGSVLTVVAPTPVDGSLANLSFVLSSILL